MVIEVLVILYYGNNRNRPNQILNIMKRSKKTRELVRGINALVVAKRDLLTLEEYNVLRQASRRLSKKGRKLNGKRITKWVISLANLLVQLLKILF